MAHPDLRWMTVDVTVETLLASVGDPDGTTGAQSKKAGVHLQADVLAGAEGATHATEDEANLVLGQ
jgi:hypothetical protein